jgi:hypothetical protein
MLLHRYVRMLHVMWTATDQSVLHSFSSVYPQCVGLSV